MEIMTMARMRGPRFKQCRRLNLNVCGHPKAMNRAGNGQARDQGKLSSYGTQLLEKQRLRAYYEVMEKQFRGYVKSAIKDTETTGEALVKQLECRLDNLVYRLGFGSSIRQARQLVSHGHIRVNGHKVDRPSYAVQVNDVISLREKSQNTLLFKENFLIQGTSPYPYLNKEVDSLSGQLIRVPDRSEVPIEVDDHLVVEFYSKAM